MNIIKKYDNVFRDIAKKEGIDNCEIVLSEKSSKGDGYLGDLNVINIIGNNNNNTSVILKQAPKSMKLREDAIILEVFSNEILFYEELWPLLKDFQEKYIFENPFNGIAACYKTGKELLEEFLILENLRETGFSMWNRKLTMDREHVILVIQEYAKFHALTFAFKNLEPEASSKVFNKIKNIFELFMEDEIKLQDFKVITDKLKVKVDNSIGDEKISAAFGKICDNWVEFFKSINNNTNEEHKVILHGDCWCNNMLFKYEDESKKTPCDMKIIDWQIIKKGPQVLDIAHFLYVCTSKEIFDDINNLLAIYHKTFSEYAANLGVNRKNIITFADLKKQWHTFGKYGLMMSFMALKIMICDSEEAPDMAESLESGDSFVKAFDYETKHEKEYQRRLNDIILHCYANNFI